MSGPDDSLISQVLIGERIRDFRVVEGMTQEELATAVDLSQTTISHAERSMVDPADVIDRIIDHFDYPYSFFAEDPAPQIAGTLRFRKLARASKKESDRVSRLFLESHRAAARLATFTGVAAPDLSSIEGDDIEAAALATRRLMGIADDIPVDHVIRRCEAAGIAVFPIRLPGFEPDHETVGHSGVSAWDPWDIPAIGYLPAQSGDRLRHTIAHELGHLVLHRQLPPVTADGRRQVENRASSFASAFLVPAKPLRAAVAGRPVTLDALRTLKAGWGVSIASLIMRTAEVGLIDERRKISLFKQLSARGWRRSEPVPVAVEEPVLLRRMLDRVSTGDPDITVTVSLGRTTLDALVDRPSGDRADARPG